MLIQEHINLKPYNTFGVTAYAKYFAEVNTVDELLQVLNDTRFQKKIILGGGSNMLLTKDIDALVIHINLKGIEVVEETENSVFIKAKAGENWHEFVMYCLKNNIGGIENLSLIPGNVGTAPIQNIGAYGVELKDVFHSCEALNLHTGKIKNFDLKDCNFEYRSSVFKTTEKGNYIITNVTLRLTKKDHDINTGYGAIKEELSKMQVTHPTIKDISNAVIAIRQSKLPDPKELGNSGSFFKNPVVDKTTFTRFIKKQPGAPFYKLNENAYKIPAGWLIEQAGFKGKRFGDAGVHKQQALVLVNYGNATGGEILNLSKNIQEKVQDLFGIILEAEVNVL
ncbi:UDP-N-acetylmuramate dehydrogenase [Planktosalinus lacus]|uniref:UDP-N-acetylenolpyruvoylglucosamine reductase n=1 Tax=Planktosalinus lacus TaxID=1526573 RepID=A0A8J2V9G8_9FLAO|nr:UDP-N-acetylmuramate dehydrogenase [Planktosalinus lacus]GGD87613.1 UDP-N-acetylenolpyruvoylglucosamine reductase [Planktosalinus lacus]